jgi:hypothetical protein
MKLVCTHCGHEVDIEDSNLTWKPPRNPARSIAALECPGCSKVEDFIEWSHRTGRQRPKAA